MYIVIQNGLQYNAHDSGYSNKQGGKKGKKGKMEKNNKRKQNQNSSLHVFRLTKVFKKEIGKAQKTKKLFRLVNFTERIPIWRWQHTDKTSTN